MVLKETRAEEKMYVNNISEGFKVTHTKKKHWFNKLL
jgi:hypothetical protein